MKRRERKKVVKELKIAHQELRSAVYDFRCTAKKMKLLHDKVKSGWIGQ